MTNLTFTISSNEQTMAEKWLSKHKCMPSRGLDREPFWIIRPTAIGYAIAVGCKMTYADVVKIAGSAMLTSRVSTIRWRSTTSRRRLTPFVCF